MKLAQLEAKLNTVDIEQVKKLEERIIDVQARSMRDNLVFYNVEEDDKENAEDLVKDTIHDEMKIEENISFQRVHRICPKFGKDGKRRDKPIEAKFSSFKMKGKVKFSAKRLADTNVSVAE